MRAALLLVLASLAGGAFSAGAQTRPLPDSVGASVEGVVLGRFQREVRPVPYALLELSAPGLARSSVADSEGRYRLGGLPAGVARLRVSAPGYDALSVEVLVPGRGSVPLRLELRGRPVELAPIDVRGLVHVPDPEGRTPELGALAEVEVTALDLAPGVGQPGLLDVVGAVPGNDPADPTDVLFMRGSTTDLKLVLLDGAPVYTPFHVAGLLRSFEPGVLGSATLHVGGAPARYDGGLTHILDLETRRPYRGGSRGSGSIDLLSATAALEGPVGGSAGYLVSARTLHGLGDVPLGGSAPYGYRDVLLGVEAEPGDDDLLRGTAFWNEESVLLDFPGGLDAAWWSNRAASLRYGTRVSGVAIDAAVAGSAYEASLPLQPTGEPGRPPPPQLLATAATDRLRVTLEATTEANLGTVRTGASFESLRAAYDARTLAGGSPGAASRATTTGAGAYVDVTRGLGDGVTFRGGLRGDVFEGGRHLRVAPRAALMWEIGPDALLTVAAGRYHQPSRAPRIEVEHTMVALVEDSLPASELLPIASADHVVLALEQLFAERVRLALEGFWKRYDGLLSDPGETVRSSGVDLRLLSGAERGSVWLGYGLSWFWSTRDLSGSTTEFEGRHLLSAGLSGRLAGIVGGELRMAYGAGLPYTAIPFRAPSVGEEATNDTGRPRIRGEVEVLSVEGGTPTQGLEDEFLRLDLEVHALIERTWEGRDWEIRPYLRVLNALDRRDALFYAFQPWRDDSLRPLAERPFLPVLGVAFRF